MVDTNCTPRCEKNEPTALPTNTPTFTPSGNNSGTEEVFLALLNKPETKRFGGSIELPSDNPGESAIASRTSWHNFLFLFPATIKPELEGSNASSYVGEMGRGPNNDYSYIRAVAAPGADPVNPVPALDTEVRFYDTGAVSIGITSTGDPEFTIFKNGDVKLGAQTVNIFDLATRLATLETTP